jgi:hypothetical protein
MKPKLINGKVWYTSKAVRVAAIKNFRRMTRSIRKSCFGSIVKGSSNFWIGSIANGIRRKLYLQIHRAEGFALIGSTKVRWTEAPGRFLKWTEGERPQAFLGTAARMDGRLPTEIQKFPIDTLYFPDANPESQLL